MKSSDSMVINMCNVLLTTTCDFKIIIIIVVVVADDEDVPDILAPLVAIAVAVGDQVQQRRPSSRCCPVVCGALSLLT